MIGPYYLSVDNLVTHGRFDILSVSAATMVFQLFWGGLFGFIFGMSFGVLRMSTIVITLLGGLAVFGMARELGVRRERAALGMAVYLFNPDPLRRHLLIHDGSRTTSRCWP